MWCFIFITKDKLAPWSPVRCVRQQSDTLSYFYLQQNLEHLKKTIINLFRTKIRKHPGPTWAQMWLRGRTRGVMTLACRRRSYRETMRSNVIRVQMSRSDRALSVHLLRLNDAWNQKISAAPRQRAPCVCLEHGYHDDTQSILVTNCGGGRLEVCGRSVSMFLCVCDIFICVCVCDIRMYRRTSNMAGLTYPPTALKALKVKTVFYYCSPSAGSCTILFIYLLNIYTHFFLPVSQFLLQELERNGGGSQGK